MSRPCEDYPCCGHGPVSGGGDGGGCPDKSGRFGCVTCGKKLAKNARSSICDRCRRRMASNPEAFEDSMELDQ